MREGEGVHMHGWRFGSGILGTGLMREDGFLLLISGLAFR